MQVPFGTKKVSKVMDTNGSTVSAEVTFVDGVTNGIRVEYTVRHKVDTHEAERSVYDSFSKKYQDNPRYLDPRFTIERTVNGNRGGYYYAVVSWREMRDGRTHKDLVDLLQKL